MVTMKGEQGVVDQFQADQFLRKQRLNRLTLGTTIWSVEPEKSRLAPTFWGSNRGEPSVNYRELTYAIIDRGFQMLGLLGLLDLLGRRKVESGL